MAGGVAKGDGHGFPPEPVLGQAESLIRGRERWLRTHLKLVFVDIIIGIDRFGTINQIG